MTELDDHELLAEFARSESETAFATLVSRHVNLVYSAGLRFTGNPHHAEEISQAVFIILARKAGSLRRGTVLSGWLYQAARLTAANFVKSETRRQRREQEAYMQSTMNEPQAAAWEQIAPLLDEAMGQLGETDRNAVVLRFFENKTAQEMAASLNLSEATAHKRAQRALEKLRKIFSKRGIALSTVAIAGVVSANSVQSAPLTVAQSVTAAAAVKGAAASGSTLILIKGAMKVMAWTKMKSTVLAGVVLLLTAGTTTVVVREVKATQTKAVLTTIQGDWEGAIDANGTKARLVFRIFQTNSVYRAVIDSPDQGASGIPVESLSAHADRIDAELPALNAGYIATLNADHTEMTGTWKQAGHSFPLTFKRATEPVHAPEPMAAEEYAPRAGSDVQGAWTGTLKMAGAQMRLNLRISETEPGTFKAQVDSVDQGANNIPVSVLTYSRPSLHLEMSAINGVYDGTLAPGRDEFSGTWNQMGKSIPLTFQRGVTTLPTVAEADKNFGTGAPNQVQGHWKGVLKVKSVSLHIIFNIALMPDGSYSATLDSIDQGASAVPATIVTFTYPILHMEWSGMGGAYTGKLDGGKITGSWRQGQEALQLNLER